MDTYRKSVPILDTGETFPLLTHGNPPRLYNYPPENPPHTLFIRRRARVRERLREILQNVTVEPFMLLNVLAWTLQTTLVTNLVLEKVCERRHNHTALECQNISGLGATEEGAIQREATWLLMVQELVANLPAVLYVLVLGSWSDKYGRKLPMLLPFVGSVLATIIYMTNALLWWLPVELVVLAGIPRGLSGGLITLLMATYSYVSDLSGLQSRTLRIAFLDFTMFVGAPLGLFLSSLLFSRFGYVGVFSVSGTGFLLSVIYIVLRIEDTREHHGAKCDMVRDLFDLTNVCATLSVATKRRKHYGRAKIFALMFAMCLLLFIIGGAQLEYLFVKKKFNWTYEQFVHLSIFDIVFGSLGTSILLPILSYKLGIEDSILGLLGCASKISGLVLMALSPSSWYLYVASIVSFLAGLPLIVTRSVISKLVPEDEIGAVFSLLASWEALVPLISGPVYTFVYSHTIDIYPGVIYFVSAGATAVAAVIYLVISTARRSAPY
ncbi:solute carrier family 46 member 3-like [Penaeus japonicus]|uniref:solute carrier family 46 member 3-like n=1 Tax=Penaeus japonicus TaxID=27405 RepID=UPI001C711975|nr:solute carrier family 46 member 3-like [Penaeus japonicus]XP_042883937.1 solute carrier family 46 member 3-like [Penaeus japonicus]